MAPSTDTAFINSLGSSVIATTTTCTAPRVCLTSSFSGLRVGPKPIKSAHLGAASVSAIATDVSIYRSPVDVPINGTVTSPASNAPVIREATYLMVSSEYDAHNKNYHMQASNAGTSEAGSIDFEGKTYNLEQLHVHTPSEHHLQGREFPMELHLVHMRESEPEPTICVLGLFVDYGEFNEEFNKVLDAMEQDHTEVSINVSKMLGRGLEQKQLVSMIGSTTTPPYHRNVQWIISQEVIHVGYDQVKRYQNIQGVEVPNNEMIHPAYDRVIVRYY